MIEAVSNSIEDDHERRILRAMAELRHGGSRLTVLNSLRAEGMDQETSDSIGAEIYIEARTRVMRARRPLILVGWVLVGISLVFFFTGVTESTPLLSIGFACLLVGMMILYNTQVR